MTPLLSVVTAGAVMAVLGVGLASILALANKKLHVPEDPRIDVVENLLPNSNCGACGSAGCRAFAEEAVAGNMAPGKCTVNSLEMIEAIAAYLGVEAGGEEKRVARLACAGGSHVAWTRIQYEGMSTCRAAALVSGGGKGCTWGCLGLADCQAVCEFDAITMDEHGLPHVHEDNCTACNACVEVCPKNLFSIHPVSHRLWVACKSLAMGDEAEAECEVACTACGRCAADAPDGVVSIENNLAVVDYTKDHAGAKCAIERCPTGAIVWLSEEQQVIKGEAAKKLLRKEPLPLSAHS